jgi:hypothetical protein
MLFPPYRYGMKERTDDLIGLVPVKLERILKFAETDRSVRLNRDRTV